MSSTVSIPQLSFNAAALARLAERWRPVGLFLACLDREGNLQWHDQQMPRILSLCLTTDSLISQQIKHQGETVPAEGFRLQAPLPWIQMQVIPVMKRRKVNAWIAFIGRTDQGSPASEELAHFAQRASIDAQLLASLSHKAPLVPIALFGTLARVAAQMHEDLQTATATTEDVARFTEQLTTAYEEIALLYKISSGMRFSQKPQAFLDTVCREVQEIGDVRAVLVALTRRGEDPLAADLDEISVTVGDCRVDAGELFKVLREPIHDALSIGEPQFHNEIAPDCDWAVLRDRIKRFVCVPLKRDNRPFGILLAIDKNDATEFNSVDLKLLGNIGNQCSMFLENAALYNDMRDLFMGVLHALTQSIDAKDTYTRGHSQRVAELSKALAQKMGLSDEQCERVYLSGLLHDVGKIGVPEAVLTKPGRLTDEEFDAIKKHPAIGGQILGNIRQLQDIIPGVLYHHERWDGRGYPHAIAGETIPLMGRIICVADSFDAMSSTRTYRPALPLETVLEEIKRCAGVQFDPMLAKLFITLDFAPYLKAVAEHQRGVSAVALPGENA